MARRPFNVLTFLNDREIDRNLDFSNRALAALHIALDAARSTGDAAHFDRLARHYRRDRQDVLALDPTAAIPDVSLEFAAAAHPAA